MKSYTIICLLCLAGCRTVKTKEKSEQMMNKDMKMNTIAVKAATRETNRITYWPEGNVYQFERLTEQVDEARVEKVTSEERQLLKQQEVVKERVPLRLWIYAGLGLLLVVGLWLYFKI